MCPNFNYQQQVAIYKVAKMMVCADGKVMVEEKMTLEDGFKKLGLSSASNLSELRKEASEQEYNSSLQILSELESVQKKFVTSFLGTIISSDGDIDDKVEDAGNIVIAQIQIESIDQQGADKLAQAGQTAGVKVKGDEKQINCGSIDELEENCDQRA